MNRVIAIALIAALGCEKSSTEAPSPSPSNDGVQILAPGAEPKRLLRYQLKKGAHTPISIAMDMDFDIAPRPMAMPTLVMNVDLGVDSLAPDGTAYLKNTITSLRVVDRATASVPISALEPLAQQLGGMVYSCTLAPDGSMSDTKVLTEVPPALKDQLPQLMQSFEQVAMRLPPVPVGVGARWTSRKITKQNGMELATVTTVTLTKMDGDKIDFAAETTVSGPDQKVTQNGIELDMKDLGGGGTSKASVDLWTMAMINETSSEFRSKVSAQGQTTSMRVVLKITIK